MVALYRLPDFVMGPMYNPYYHDLGIAKDTVAVVRGSFGLVATFVGLAAAGLCTVRIGMMPTLVAGLVLEGFGTAAFALLAFHVDAATFAVVMSLDAFAQAFAGAAARCRRLRIEHPETGVYITLRPLQSDAMTATDHGMTGPRVGGPNSSICPHAATPD